MFFRIFLSLFCLRFEVSVQPNLHVVVCSRDYDVVYTNTSLPAFWRPILFADGLRNYQCLSTKCNRQLSHVHPVPRKRVHGAVPPFASVNFIVLTKPQYRLPQLNNPFEIAKSSA